MLPEKRSQSAGLGENYGEDWNLPGLVVNDKFKAVRQERAHHLAHLVFGDVVIVGAGLEVEAIGLGPIGQRVAKGGALAGGDFVGEADEGVERHVDGGVDAAGIPKCVFRSAGYVDRGLVSAAPLRAGFVLPDGDDIKLELVSGC